VLEAGYIVHRLPPQHRNLNKCLVKTPMLYFVDVSLAARLLRLETPQQLACRPFLLVSAFILMICMVYRYSIYLKHDTEHREQADAGCL